MENQPLLRKFWEFLKIPPPLDALQASYFTKVNESMLDKKTEEMLDLFKSMDGAVKDMLQHVDSPMVMDLLLKIISLEKQEGGAGIVDVGFSADFSYRPLTKSVASFSGLNAHITVLSLFRALLGNADIGWRFLESHNYHFRKCISKRTVMYWTKRAYKAACFETMHRKAHF